MDRAVAPLKIGIVTGQRDGYENWELMVFDRILTDPRLELVTLLVHPRPYAKRRASPAFAFVSRIERLALARQAAYHPERFDPAGQRFDDIPAEDDAVRTLALVAETGLDLVIRLTPGGLPDAAVGSLAYGEWAFTFSDQVSRHADCYGYDDVIERKATTPLTLYARCGHGGATVEISSAAFNTKISAARNGAFLKERAVTLLMRELGRLADTRRLSTVSLKVEPPVSPSLMNVATYACRLSFDLVSRFAKSAMNRVGPEIWTLYTGKGDIGNFDPAQSVEIPSFAGEIKADPFLFELDGECYLFYESCSRANPKAHIAVGRFVGDTVVPLGPVLIGDHDLSYPFVFRAGDDIFMLPENHRSRRVELWRCVDFPMKWELHSTALEGFSAADSVLIQRAGKWWLFTNISDFHAYEDHCSELHIFEVDGPELKRVTPHRRNPVVMGSAVARNGGRILECDGKLYRPAQCSAYGIFGWGLNIMEIEELDIETYVEKCVRRIEPDFKTEVLGCHHFDSSGGRYVIDARLTI